MRILWTLPTCPGPPPVAARPGIPFAAQPGSAWSSHHAAGPVQNPLDDDARAALEPWLERLIVIDRRPLLSLRTLLAVAFAAPPMLASVNGYAPQLEKVFEQLLEEDWDIIQLQHTYAFQPFERALKRSGKPFVLTEHNVESDLGAASYDRLPRWANAFAVYDRWRYRRWETRVFRQTGELIAVTEDDAKALSRLSGRATSYVVNSVDCDYYASVHADRHSHRLLFIGNYEYGPNVDAIEWALDEIMPKVWALAPHVRFAIGGFGMPPAWRERWPDPRIDWLGFVPDLRALQATASMFFAPLRQGGGSKLKTLEAMAAGLPVVTTAQGFPGWWCGMANITWAVRMPPGWRH